MRIAAAPDVPAGGAAQAAAPASEMTLHRAIVKGLREQAGSLTEAALKTTPPLEIINGALIPALDEVGKGFEKGTVFLPQLLMSADAAKEAFDRTSRRSLKAGVWRRRKRAASCSRPSRATSTTSGKTL